MLKKFVNLVGFGSLALLCLIQHKNLEDKEFADFQNRINRRALLKTLNDFDYLKHK